MTAQGDEPKEVPPQEPTQESVELSEFRKGTDIVIDSIPEPISEPAAMPVYLVHPRISSLNVL